ncbi:unnamed protein product [Merluccius merluccius]
MLSGPLGAGFPNLHNIQDHQNAGPGCGSSSPDLPGFGTPWSVQTSPSPPPPPGPNPINQNQILNNRESPVHPAFFQGFPPVPACPGSRGNLQGFTGSFLSPEMNGPLRSRCSPPVVKQTPWGGHQGGGWGSGGVPWSRDQRRAPGLGMAGSVSHLSPMKKPFSSHIIAPPKFPRSAVPPGPKTLVEKNGFRTDGNSNSLPLQDRSRMLDNMRSLESSLIDIMRAEHDPMKGRSSLFPMEDGLLEDGPLGVLGPTCFHPLNADRMERFSRKVFIGGLPPDIDEDEITSSFQRFGHLVVDWPHKAESKSYFPPKGYAFLLFQEESAVQALMEACLEGDGKLYLCVSSPTIKDKPVQIRPWNLSDSDFVMDGSQPLDPRKTIFVGGVPRPLRASKYDHFLFVKQLHFLFLKQLHLLFVEVKPYVLDDQLCDECQGACCGGKFAPFFCASVTCLQYYCEFCWANIHARAGRDFHKPLVKEGADHPRQVHFRWN